MAKAETAFDSSCFFENATYNELCDEVYHPRKKSSRQEFLRFICANLKELEFKKVSGKSDQLCYSYNVEFDEEKEEDDDNDDDKDKDKDKDNEKDKDKGKMLIVTIMQIRVYPNENDGRDDIRFAVFEKVKQKWTESDDEQFKDVFCERDNGAKFEIMMDRTMDCLEVLEKGILGIECGIQLNIDKEASPIKKAISPKKSAKKNSKKKASSTEDYDPDTDEDGSGKGTVDHSDDDSDDKSNSKKKSKSNKRKYKGRKRRRKELNDYDDMSSDDDGSGYAKSPKQKKRRKHQSKKEKMKEELSECWVDGNYTELMDIAKDEYNMSDNAINDIMREFWKLDVLPKYK